MYRTLLDYAFRPIVDVHTRVRAHTPTRTPTLQFSSRLTVFIDSIFNLFFFYRNVKFSLRLIKQQALNICGRYSTSAKWLFCLVTAETSPRIPTGQETCRAPQPCWICDMRKICCLYLELNSDSLMVQSVFQALYRQNYYYGYKLQPGCFPLRNKARKHWTCTFP